MWRSKCVRSFGRRIELQAPDELRILVLTLVQVTTRQDQLAAVRGRTTVTSQQRPTVGLKCEQRCELGWCESTAPAGS